MGWELNILQGEEESENMGFKLLHHKALSC